MYDILSAKKTVINQQQDCHSHAEEQSKTLFQKQIKTILVSVIIDTDLKDGKERGCVTS